MAGKLSDVYGRKKILLVGMIVLVISALLSAFVPSFWLFIACRGVTGFTIGKLVYRLNCFFVLMSRLSKIRGLLNLMSLDAQN